MRRLGDAEKVLLLALSDGPLSFGGQFDHRKYDDLVRFGLVIRSRNKGGDVRYEINPSGRRAIAGVSPDIATLRSLSPQ